MGARFTSELNEHPHALYRFWSAESRLLYIGLTVDPGARWRIHSREKSWWTDVATVTLEWFPDRPSVEAAEKAAIITERPMYNVTHQPPRPKPVLVRVTELPLAERLNGGEWLSVPQVTELLRPYWPSINRTTVHRWVKAGKIRYRATPGGHVMLDPGDVVNLVKVHRTRELVTTPSSDPTAG